MHGPYVTVEDKQRKAYLLCFLDDMSRLVLHAEFYLHEKLECFLDCFRKALLKRGVPRKLYVDNGSAFRSHHLEHTCASLGIVLIHSKPYQPEGRGKQERVFRTVREQFLSVQKATTLSGLNESLGQWIDSYNDRIHSITKEEPLRRFINFSIPHSLCCGVTLNSPFVKGVWGIIMLTVWNWARDHMLFTKSDIIL
jgi:transposase InsO family protein